MKYLDWYSVLKLPSTQKGSTNETWNKTSRVPASPEPEVNGSVSVADDFYPQLN